MKQWVYRKLIKPIKLFGAYAKFNWLQTMAYWQNNWGQIVSTVFYIFSFIIFLHVIIQKYTSIGSYTGKELYIIFAINQITFYTLWAGGVMTFPLDLVDKVRTGYFDYYLVRPWGVLITLLGRNLKLFVALQSGIIPMAIVFAFIDWRMVFTTVTLINFLESLIVWILGIIGIYSLFLFISSLVFYLGEATGLIGIFFKLNSSTNAAFIPVTEIMNKGFLAYVILTLIPNLICTIITGAVLLNKISFILALKYVLLVLLVLIILAAYSWKYGLKHYTSASS